jgi:hypothetical protein
MRSAGAVEVDQEYLIGTAGLLVEHAVDVPKPYELADARAKASGQRRS